MRYVNYFKKPVFWLIIPFSIYLIFGLIHLNKFETADEALWISDPFTGRIHGYWQALSDRNWIQTRINDKPGISLALISGIGIFFEGNPQEKLLTSKEESPRIYNPEANQRSYLAFRLPILIFNGLMSFFFFYAIRRLTRNDFIAFLTATLILLSPILLGVSQIINPDSLLWSLGFASLISFLNFSENGGKKWIFFSMLFFGFSLLSKYTAVIFIPFFFLIVLWKSCQEVLEKGDKVSYRQLALKNMAWFPAIIFGGLSVFSFFMPAVLLNLKFLYDGTFGFKSMHNVSLIFLAMFIFYLLIFLELVFFKGRFSFSFIKSSKPLITLAPRMIFFALASGTVFAVINWLIGKNFLGVDDIAFDSGRSDIFQSLTFFQKLMLEPRALVFSLPPVVIFSAVFLWIMAAFKKTNFQWIAFILSAFILSFFAAVFFQDLLVNIRYSIMLYPIISFLAALGIHNFLVMMKKDNSKMSWIIAASFAILISVWSILSIKPYYFNYTNDLLPKNKIITGAWGYGGYEAAAYLNALPDAKNLRVWSDYEGFCSFFSGKCVRISTAINYKEEFPKAVDYFVSSRRGNITNENIWKYLKKNKIFQEQPVWELIIGRRPENFVRIFKNNVIN